MKNAADCLVLCAEEKDLSAAIMRIEFLQNLGLKISKSKTKLKLVVLKCLEKQVEMYCFLNL